LGVAVDKKASSWFVLRPALRRVLRQSGGFSFEAAQSGSSVSPISAFLLQRECSYSSPSAETLQPRDLQVSVYLMWLISHRHPSAKLLIVRLIINRSRFGVFVRRCRLPDMSNFFCVPGRAAGTPTRFSLAKSHLDSGACVERCRNAPVEMPFDNRSGNRCRHITVQGSFGEDMRRSRGGRAKIHRSSEVSRKPNRMAACAR